MFIESGINVYKFPNELIKLFINLKVIKIYHGSLAYVNRKQLKDYVKLEEIHLPHNSISILESDVFLRTKNLQVINFEENDITYLGFGTFVHLKKLQKLNLRNNGLFSFYAVNQEEVMNFIPYFLAKHHDVIIHDVFRCEFSMKTLKYIGKIYRCKANNFDVFDVPSQSNYPPFFKVHFAFGNQLPGKSDNDVKAFSSSQMQMSLFPIELQNIFKNLMSIEVVESGVELVMESSFIELEDLTTIDLSYNSICTIYPKTFENNKKLISVNLEENNLIKIASELLKNNPEIQEVNFLRNLCVDSTFNDPEMMGLNEEIDVKCRNKTFKTCTNPEEKYVLELAKIGKK